MDVLKRRFGVEGNAVGWLAEFLCDQSQVVHVDKMESASHCLLAYLRGVSLAQNDL